MHISILRLRRLCSLAAGLGADRAGTAAVILAVSLSSVIGIAGLGTEAANWYMSKRTMQGAADAAAYTAATTKASGEATTDIRNAANSVAASYGLVNGTGGVTITINSPPASGSYSSNSSAVEVIISQTLRPLLSGVVLTTGPTITARSVTVATVSGTGCIVALNRNSVVGATTSGSTTLNMTACSLFINSSNSAALTMSSSATINAKSAYIVGGTSLGGGTLTTTSGTYTGIALPLNDPYGTVA